MEDDYSTPVTLSEIATKLIEVHEITTIVYSADHYVPYPSPVVVDYDETEFHFGGDTSFKFRFTMSPMLVNRITVLDAVLRAAFPIASEGYFEFDCTDEVEVEEIIGNHYGAFKITIHEDGWAMLINHDPTDDYYSRTRKIKIIRQV